MRCFSQSFFGIWNLPVRGVGGFRFWNLTLMSKLILSNYCSIFMTTTSEISNISFEQPIVLFDGVCNLCNGFVQFIIKRDKKGIVRFASLQSDFGQQVLQKFNLGSGTDQLSTVILIENNKAYTHSDVALRLVKYLGYAWPILSIFRILPRFIRDGIYNWIAKNRYRWFGKSETCMIPNRNIENRFLGN